MSNVPNAVTSDSLGNVSDRTGSAPIRPIHEIETVVGQATELVRGVRQSVGDAVSQIRQDHRMEKPETRRAALKLLAYIAGALLILNALLHAPRRR
jgi:hypothetical protein